MTKDEKAPPPTPDLTELTRQGMEQVRAAFANYLNSFQGAAQGEADHGKEMSSTFANYAGRNVANAVAFAQKLAQVKDVQDLVKLQTEFFKSQMEAVAAQAAAVRESAEKAAAERLERAAALAEQVFGDRVKARRWLRRPRRTLQGQTAIAYLASDSGAQVVEAMLQRMQKDEPATQKDEPTT
jgi:hypothetical protein